VTYPVVTNQAPTTALDFQPREVHASVTFLQLVSTTFLLDEHNHAQVPLT